jgi:hypothetical protein
VHDISRCDSRAFVILGTDGLWGLVSNDEAAHIVLDVASYEGLESSAAASVHTKYSCHHSAEESRTENHECNSLYGQSRAEGRGGFNDETRLRNGGNGKWSDLTWLRRVAAEAARQLAALAFLRYV